MLAKLLYIYLLLIKCKNVNVSVCLWTDIWCSFFQFLLVYPITCNPVLLACFVVVYFSETNHDFCRVTAKGGKLSYPPNIWSIIPKMVEQNVWRLRSKFPICKTLRSIKINSRTIAYFVIMCGYKRWNSRRKRMLWIFWLQSVKCVLHVFRI